MYQIYSSLEHTTVTLDALLLQGDIKQYQVDIPEIKTINFDEKAISESSGESNS